MIWRFRRGEREFVVCDSGQVPFAVGSGARAHLQTLGAGVYPPRPRQIAAHSRLAAYADGTCAWARSAFDAALRRSGGRSERVRIGLWRAYIGGHERQLRALEGPDRPRGATADYRAWLGYFARRVGFEREQLRALRHGDLDGAAAIAARTAVLKARENAHGLAFGLRTCTAQGPAGAPRS